MDIYEYWQKAVKETEILRSRVRPLATTSDTTLPYILLSQSSVNRGDTVVRSGSVVVQKPSLILPSQNPQFSGFELQEQSGFNENSFLNFLLVRGIKFPSMKYNNTTSSLDVFEGHLEKARQFYLDRLQREEEVSTGLLTGPQECWQFSLLLFICMLAMRNAQQDIAKLLDELRKRNIEDN